MESDVVLLISRVFARISGSSARKAKERRVGPRLWGTVGNAPCTTGDSRNGSGDGDMATMMVVVDDDGGGGKYGTPGAGVIIYLAPEIGPADTAGRFNGRTMLELTKTKTKHQLGDFFFHFSFASFTSASSLSLHSLCSPLSSTASRKRSEEGAYNVYAWSTYAILG